MHRAALIAAVLFLAGLAGYSVAPLVGQALVAYPALLGFGLVIYGLLVMAALAPFMLSSQISQEEERREG